jgi:hypothetical protein
VREALTEEVINEAYENIRRRVASLAGVSLPDQCPYSREAILNAVSALEFAA